MSLSLLSNSTKQPSPSHNTLPSIISTGLAVKGNLSTDGELQIDGSVEGDIVAGKLIIGEHAKVKGEVTAETVIVRGELSGCIRARVVELSPTARVQGDVWHESLAIEAGANVDGTLNNSYRRDAAKNAPIVGT
jgi:cytoskeletal protein CcmA (bactofilin family)